MPSDRSRTALIGVTLFALLSSIYLLTYRGTFTAATDEGALFASVEGLVKWGWPTTNQMPLGHNGRYRDGIFYTTYEPAQYLLATPLYAAASLLPRVGLLQTVFLFNIFVTTLAALFIFLYVRRLGYGHRVATLCALAFGLLTTAWPYSKTFWREPLSGLGLVAAMYFTVDALRAESPKSVRWKAGLAMFFVGLAGAAKQTSLVAAPAFLAVAGPSLVRRFRVRSWNWRPGAATAAAALAGLTMTLGAMALLYGLLLGRTGLGVRDSVLLGFLNQPLGQTLRLVGERVPAELFSPGKGLFVHSPVLIMALLGFAVLIRRRRYAEALLPTLVALSVLLTYSQYHTWWGGRAWGPRYLVPILPALAVLLAPVFRKLLETGSRVFTAAAITLVVASFVVQIAGVSVGVEPFHQQLTETGPGPVSREAIFDPRYSEIPGHLLLLSPQNLDFAWARQVEGQTVIDLFVVIPVGLSIALFGAALYLSVSELELSPTRRRALIIAGLVVPIVLSGLSLARYSRDPHYVRGPEWFDLLEHVQASAGPGDVLILQEGHQYIDFLFNYNRAALPWYTLPSRPPPLDGLAREVVQDLSRQYQRIWLATDRPPQDDPGRGIEQWLTANLFRLEDVQFSYLARLMLFTRGPSSEIESRADWSAASPQGVRLTGYDYAPAELEPGEDLYVRLKWSAAQKIQEDYTASVQLLDESGRLVTQVDRYPQEGLAPTSSWEHGTLIGDNYVLEMPADAAPGDYRVTVVVYSLLTLERLDFATTEADGDRIDLGSITIVG